MKITESQLREIVKSTLMEAIEEKAKSKAQQRFMAMVRAVQKGELDADEVGSSVTKAAKSMKKSDVKDFAETKHKGLPNHVDESGLRKIIRSVLKEVSDDTVDSAYMKALYDTNKYPYDDPMAVRRRAQVANIRNMRDERLGFNPSEMSGIMRTRGTSGNPSIDRRWATWQKNHVDRVNGRRTYNDKTGRWQTNNELQESVNKENIKNIIRESIDELSINTMHNAYDKMLRYGQSDRASDLGAKSWKKIYHSNIDNLTIFTNAWGINVSDPSFASKNFIFNVEKCEWEGYQPRFSDRKAANILAQLIQRECGEKAGEFANKQLYIK